MSTSENEGMELIAEMVNRFEKSYEEMTSLGEDIKQHMLKFQKSLEQKLDELKTKERAFEKKKAEYHVLLEEREAAVIAKEQTLLDRIQELKDASVSDIIDAHEKNLASPALVNTVSTSANDVLNEPFLVPEENISVNKSSHLAAEATSGKDEPQSKLKQLCKQMNVKGLLKFISENRKNIGPLRDELPFALRSANKPAHFVLRTLEGFYPQNQPNISPNSKEYRSLLVLRRTCLLLMESVAPLLTTSEPGDDHLLSSEIKKQAKVIADEWKLKLAGVPLDASIDSLEAQAFLQLIVTFSISSEFDEDELCKLVVAISRRRRKAPELCRAVGLAHKSQDVVEVLIAKGRMIDAVHFSHFFQLTEIFPLVPLLKQSLEKAEEIIARSIAIGLEKEAANQELTALDTVIRCIEEYKLQEEYPLNDLEDRIKDVERTKTSTKRKVDEPKFLRKRSRVNDRHTNSNTPIAGNNGFAPPTTSDERLQYSAGQDRYPYPVHSPYLPSGHMPPYQHQVNVPRPYHYPDERLPHTSSSNYASYSPSMQPAPGNYGNYMSSGIQYASSNYGSYMGRPSSHQSYNI